MEAAGRVTHTLSPPLTTTTNVGKGHREPF